MSIYKYKNHLKRKLGLTLLLLQHECQDQPFLPNRIICCNTCLKTLMRLAKLHVSDREGPVAQQASLNL